MTSAAGTPVAVHQFIATLNPHDATGTHALKLRDALRSAGWRSEIFAEAIHDDLVSEAYKHWMYPEHAAPGDVAIYQFTTSSAVAGYLAEQGLPLILDFHNFTGAEYFTGWEPRGVKRAAAAADELALLAPRDMAFELSCFARLEGPQKVGRQIVAPAIVICLVHANPSASSPRIFSKPSRIRPFTVPSGTSSMVAISEWLKPPK